MRNLQFSDRFRGRKWSKFGHFLGSKRVGFGVWEGFGGYKMTKKPYINLKSGLGFGGCFLGVWMVLLVVDGLFFDNFQIFRPNGLELRKCIFAKDAVF